MNHGDANSVKIEYVQKSEDVLSLLEHFDSVFPHLKEKISSYAEYAEKLSRFAHVCVIKLEGELCGLLVYYANDKETRTAYIALIGVMEKFQGRRIGQRLLEHCVERSLAYGMHRLNLEVDLDNEQAIRFYKKHGFCECGKKSYSSMYLTKSLLNL